MKQGRTVEEVLQDLTENEQTFLQRVLEQELAKLHLQDPDMTDELVAVVKEILP